MTFSFNLPPKYLPTDFVVETLEESRSSRELAAEYNRLNRKLGKVIGDEDIEILKNLKEKIGLFKLACLTIEKKQIY